MFLLLVEHCVLRDGHFLVEPDVIVRKQFPLHSFFSCRLISWKVLHPLASGCLLLAQWAASDDCTYMAWLTGPKKFSAAIEFLFSRQFLGWFLFASLASIAHQKRKKRHAGRYYPPVRRFYYFRFYAAVFPRRLNLSLQSGLIIVIAALSARLFLSLVSIVLTYLLCGPPSRLFCIACDISKFLTWLFLLSTIHLRV
jgi:hypothetical protein